MVLQFLRRHSVPVTVSLYAILSYGLLIPFLGFYWDDWPMIWFSFTQGPAGFPGAFAGDRPFLAIIYQLTTTFIKYVPWQWQVLGVISRILTALAFWWAFSKVWPRQAQKLAWAALLFVVYPGFKQQPISVVYSNGFVPLTAYFLSFGFMALAIRNPRRYWPYTLAGMASFLFCMFSTEYYFGLELIRPVILLLLLGGFSRQLRQKLLPALKHWLPYLAAFAAIFYWRVFVFKFPTYQPQLLQTAETDPLQSLLRLAWRAFYDPLLAGIKAWTTYIRFPQLTDFNQTAMMLYWAMVIIVFLLTLVVLYRLLPQPALTGNQPAEPQQVNQQMMIVGGLALLLAGAPFWITGLRLELFYPHDRFTMAFMLGSVLFVTGFVSWLARTQTQRMVVIALLVAMATGENFLNDNTYRKEWLTHNDFFHQLAWRVPGLDTGTVLLTYDLPLHYYSDNSLTGPLNLVFAPENRSLELPYYFAFLDVRLGRSIQELTPGLPITQAFRNASFNGSTDQILVLFYSPPGCLRVLDPVRDADLRIMPSELLAAVPISNPGVIQPSSGQPVWLPESVFGKADQNQWCYYYQKADLARQMGDWPSAMSLIEEAYTRRLAPQEASEVILPIEVYGMSGNWPRVHELMVEAYNSDQHFQRQFCQTLDKIVTETSSRMSGADQLIYEELRGRLTCDAVTSLP